MSRLPGSLHSRLCRPLPRFPLIRSFPRSSVAAATLTVHLARSHGSIVEDLQAALAQFTEIAAELDALLATIPSRALKGKL